MEERAQLPEIKRKYRNTIDFIRGYSKERIDDLAYVPADLGDRYEVALFKHVVQQAPHVGLVEVNVGTFLLKPIYSFFVDVKTMHFIPHRREKRRRGQTNIPETYYSNGFVFRAICHRCNTTFIYTITDYTCVSRHHSIGFSASLNRHAIACAIRSEARPSP